MREEGGVFLRADEPRGRDQWLDLWRRWPERDPTAHPDFVRLFTGPGEVPAAYVRDAAGSGVLFPFILRPLALQPWASPGEPAWDLTSPYGYSGAFTWGPCPESARQAFWEGFEATVRRLHVVTTFVRLSVLDGLVLPFPWDVQERGCSVVRTLGLAPDALWYDYEHKVRKNVNRARAAGLRVEIDDTGSRLAEFLEIYRLTMDRRSAAEAYYFKDAFFRSILADLAGQYVFFHATSGDRVVSTELVLVSPAYIYSYLGGTREEAFAERPNDLLKHAIIEWGGRTGRRAFALGGGYGVDDGVFRYKKSFAPGGVVPFHIGLAIHDRVGYERLLEQRSAFERHRGIDWTPAPGYFPAYRA